MKGLMVYPGRALAVTAQKLREGYSSFRSILTEIHSCPECKSAKLRNSSNGELFCRDCGLVIL